MSEIADDLKYDYSYDESDDSREPCRCGRLVTEDEQVFNGEYTVCVHCEDD